MRIHHIGYLVKSLRKSEEAFRRLGYRMEQGAKYDPCRKVWISFLRNGEYLVELVEPEDKDSPLYPLLKHYKNSPYHICYIVAHLDEAIRELTGENGYTLFQEPQAAPCIGGRNVAFLMNRDLGMIELVESIQE